MKFCSSFQHDLETGLIYESRLADILNNCKIEVKRDTQYIKTGNVFIEYESRGKPSGISKTDAVYYCFFLNEYNFIFIHVLELKRICRDYVGTKRDIRGGDLNTSRGILLPLEKILLKNVVI